LNSHGGPASTIDAVIGAGIATDFAPFHLRGGTPCSGGRSAVPVDPRYAALLSRLLAPSSAGSTQCVQFVACGVQAQATGVALGAARTAASLLGRSLVINARLTLDADAFPDGMAHAPVPDAFVPRLYHHRLAQRPGDIALLFGGARRSALTTLVSPFRFVAIDCPPPSAAPSASALAPFCVGAVLVVRAGFSTREAVKEAALHVTSAGGKIIGTVLDDAPADLPRWVLG
jgi:hypothetical protein